VAESRTLDFHLKRIREGSESEARGSAEVVRNGNEPLSQWVADAFAYRLKRTDSAALRQSLSYAFAEIGSGDATVKAFFASNSHLLPPNVMQQVQRLLQQPRPSGLRCNRVFQLAN
jgi:hypothetical protein